MDKLSRAIISFINCQPNSASYFCSLREDWDSEASISIAGLSDALGVQPDDIRAAAAYLVKAGLAEYRYLSSKHGRIQIAFRLTHEGLRYRELKRLTQKERWKERLWGFLSGVTVSVISGIIISLISG